MFRVDVTTDLVRGRAEAVLGPRFGRLVHVLAAVRGHGDWWVPPQADLRACLVGRRVCRSSVGCFLWDRLRPGGSCEPGESASFRARRFRRRRYGRPICRLGCARDRGGGIRCVRPWPLPCRLGRPRCLRRGAGGAGDQTAGLDDERGDLLRAPARVTASRKSHASSASAWKRRKPPTCQRPARVPGRSLASRRISGTDDATTFTTSTSNSPCTRRYPHWRFSRNSRSTRAWMEATARGRPGRFGRHREACRPAIRSRCQRITVSGRTSSRIRRSALRCSRCSSAAGNARSGRGEPHPRSARLTFQHRNLMPQDQDLGVLIPIAGRNKAQGPRTYSSPSDRPAATTRPIIIPRGDNVPAHLLPDQPGPPATLTPAIMLSPAWINFRHAQTSRPRGWPGSGWSHCTWRRAAHFNWIDYIMSAPPSTARVAPLT